MKILAHVLIGLGVVGTAHAQANAARVEFLPMQNTMPTILFDPAPLSGTMLKPLGEPTSDPAEITITAPAAAVAQTQPDAAAPLPAGQPPAEAPASSEAAAEAPVELVPEAATEEAAVEPAPEPEPEPAPAAPAEPDSTTVTVIVEGVESSKGVVNVALCDKGLSREGCPYTQSTAAAAGFVEARFQDVPPGIYAVVGYHDVNSNDEFDKMLGVPREPYALSSKAGEMLVPGFEDAALNIKKGDNTVIIRMQRLGG
jgi:uncharacterized protein (DUF2141 family)